MAERREYELPDRQDGLLAMAERRACARQADFPSSPCEHAGLPSPCTTCSILKPGATEARAGSTACLTGWMGRARASVDGMEGRKDKAALHGPCCQTGQPGRLPAK